MEPITITYETLLELDACQECLDDFSRYCGETITWAGGFTLEDQLALIRGPLRRWFGWLVRAGLLPMRSMRGLDLSGWDLSWADLRWAHLYKAHLYRADLTMADLTGACLAGADLGGAVLRWTDLTGACLAGAIDYGAVYYGAEVGAAK